MLLTGKTHAPLHRHVSPMFLNSDVNKIDDCMKRQVWPWQQGEQAKAMAGELGEHASQVRDEDKVTVGLVPRSQDGGRLAPEVLEDL